MTDLTKNVKRRTNTISQGRRLVLEIRPGSTDTVFIREEGRRTGYIVSIECVYKLGARQLADQGRADRIAMKKARRAKQ
jgi:hypothetical protein